MYMCTYRIFYKCNHFVFFLKLGKNKTKIFILNKQNPTIIVNIIVIRKSYLLENEKDMHNSFTIIHISILILFKASIIILYIISIQNLAGDFSFNIYRRACAKKIRHLMANKNSLFFQEKVRALQLYTLYEFSIHRARKKGGK